MIVYRIILFLLVLSFAGGCAFLEDHKDPKPRIKAIFNDSGFQRELFEYDDDARVIKKTRFSEFDEDATIISTYYLSKQNVITSAFIVIDDPNVGNRSEYTDVYLYENNHLVEWQRESIVVSSGHEGELQYIFMNQYDWSEDYSSYTYTYQDLEERYEINSDDNLIRYEQDSQTETAEVFVKREYFYSTGTSFNFDIYRLRNGVGGAVNDYPDETIYSVLQTDYLTGDEVLEEFSSKYEFITDDEDRVVEIVKTTSGVRYINGIKDAETTEPSVQHTYIEYY